MAGRDERQHAEQHGHREAARPEAPARLGEHRLHLGDRVERLGHDEVGAGVELALQALPLGRASAAVGSRAQAMVNPARWPIGEPAWSSPRLRRARISIEADRVDVPDARPGRVVADPRRVAGEGQDVADAQRVGAQQLRLEGHEVAVARREVDHALEVEVVLDAEGHGHGAHPHPRHRGVADVDDVDAGRLQQARGLDASARCGRERGGSISTETTKRPRPGRAAEARRRRARRRRRAARRGRPRLRSPAARGCGRARPAAAGRAPAARRPRRSRPRRRATARIAAMWAGVVPQQPPTMRAPASSIRGRHRRRSSRRPAA